MSKKQVQQLVLGICANIEAASSPLKAIRPIAGGFEDTGLLGDLKEHVGKASRRLKTEAAKCAIMASELTDVDAQRPLLQAIEQAVVAFCALCCAMLEHAGPSLSGELNSLAIQACQLTSQFLKKAFLDRASPAEVKTSVGMVLQACEALERAPLTNKQAVGKKFVQVAMQTTDIVRETNEMVEDARQDGNTTDGANFGKESSADAPALPDLEIEPDEMEVFNISASSWQQDEVEVIVQVAPFFKGFDLLLNAVIRHIHSTPHKEFNSKLEAWEEGLKQCKAVSIVMNDFSAGLYAPQNGEELLQSFRTIQVSLQNIVLDLREISSIPPDVGNFLDAGETIMTALECLCG